MTLGWGLQACTLTAVEVIPEYPQKSGSGQQ